MQSLNIILCNCIVLVHSRHHSPDSLLEGQGVSPLISQSLQCFFVICWCNLLSAAFGLPWREIDLTPPLDDVGRRRSRLFILPLCLYILLNLVKVPYQVRLYHLALYRSHKRLAEEKQEDSTTTYTFHEAYHRQLRDHCGLHRLWGLFENNSHRSLSVQSLPVA